MARGAPAVHILPMTTVQSPWLDQFPALSALDAQSAKTLAAGARLMSVPPGTILFHEGQLCENFLLLLQGRIRIQKGRSVGAGDRPLSGDARGKLHPHHLLPDGRRSL